MKAEPTKEGYNDVKIYYDGKLFSHSERSEGNEIKDIKVIADGINLLDKARASGLPSLQCGRWIEGIQCTNDSEMHLCIEHFELAEKEARQSALAFKCPNCDTPMEHKIEVLMGEKSNKWYCSKCKEDYMLCANFAWSDLYNNYHDAKNKLNSALAEISKLNKQLSEKEKKDPICKNCGELIEQINDKTYRRWYHVKTGYFVCDLRNINSNVCAEPKTEPK